MSKYVKETWNNGKDGKTPINADRLNRMADGIVDCLSMSEGGTIGGDVVFNADNTFNGSVVLNSGATINNVNANDNNSVVNVKLVKDKIISTLVPTMGYREANLVFSYTNAFNKESDLQSNGVNYRYSYRKAIAEIMLSGINTEYFEFLLASGGGWNWIIKYVNGNICAHSIYSSSIQGSSVGIRTKLKNENKSLALRLNNYNYYYPYITNIVTKHDVYGNTKIQIEAEYNYNYQDAFLSTEEDFVMPLYITWIAHNCAV
jgi:hypothetical protein